MMKIGIPKEIKNHEHRVAVTPVGVKDLVDAGHEVWVQTDAGCAAGFSDESYQAVGAHLSADAAKVWSMDLVVKVKEPLPEEYSFFRKDLTLFTYLHLAAAPELTEALVNSGVCAIAYETVQSDNGRLPLLTPMSCIAGRLATQMGAFYLQTTNGTAYAGKGLLMGDVQGAPNAHVLILGGGNVGRNAASVALGMGANVTIMDVSAPCLESIKQEFSEVIDRLQAQLFEEEALEQALKSTDLLIGAALVPGTKAPQLLSRKTLAHMPKGGVFMDVSIDQGGMAETSRATRYDDPVYVEEGIIHCCLPNLPGCVSHSSTAALTTVTLPYVLELANSGVKQALLENIELQRGLNVHHSAVVHPALVA